MTKDGFALFTHGDNIVVWDLREPVAILLNSLKSSMMTQNRYGIDSFLEFDMANTLSTAYKVAGIFWLLVELLCVSAMMKDHHCRR